MYVYIHKFIYTYLPNLSKASLVMMGAIMVMLINYDNGSIDCIGDIGKLGTIVVMLINYGNGNDRCNYGNAYQRW